MTIESTRDIRELQTKFYTAKYSKRDNMNNIKSFVTALQLILLLAFVATIVTFYFKANDTLEKVYDVAQAITTGTVRWFDWATGYENVMNGFHNDPTHTEFHGKIGKIRKQAMQHQKALEESRDQFETRVTKIKTLMIQETIGDLRPPLSPAESSSSSSIRVSPTTTLTEEAKMDRLHIIHEGTKLIKVCGRVKNLLQSGVTNTRQAIKHLRKLGVRTGETKEAFENRFYSVELPLLKERIQWMIYNVGNTTKRTHEIQDLSNELCLSLKNMQNKHDKKYSENSKPVGRAEYIKKLGIAFCGGALGGGALAAAISMWVDPITVSTEILLGAGSVFGASVTSTYKLYSSKLDGATKALAAKSSGFMSVYIANMYNSVLSLEMYSSRILSHLETIYAAIKEIEMRSEALDVVQIRNELVNTILDGFVEINMVYEQNILKDSLPTSSSTAATIQASS
jgi:hypothetical protein